MKRNYEKKEEAKAEKAIVQKFASEPLYEDDLCVARPAEKPASKVHIVLQSKVGSAKLSEWTAAE